MSALLKSRRIVDQYLLRCGCEELLEVAIPRRSVHQHSVDAFMRKAQQALPDGPVVPDAATRVLRAKLIYEEAMETINALGVSVHVAVSPDENHAFLNSPLMRRVYHAEFRTRDIREPASIDYPVDLQGVVDGCCDVSVVTIGTLSAFGVPGYLHQRLVDASNMAKFGPGGHRRDDGKWIKPPDWQKPPLGELLVLQGANPDLIFDD